MQRVRRIVAIAACLAGVFVCHEPLLSSGGGLADTAVCRERLEQVGTVRALHGVQEEGRFSDVSAYASGIAAARERMKRLLELRGRETIPDPSEVPTGFRMHPAEIHVDGVPISAAPFAHAGNVVFRHYIVEKDSVGSISDSSELLSGFLPYVVISPGVSKKLYRDLTGVFLTRPDVKPMDVGVTTPGASIDYIDFTLDSSVPVLEIEPGRIYLVPLPARYRDWMIDRYVRFKSGAELPAEERKTCEEMEKAGGVQAPDRIPIRIEAVGRLVQENTPTFGYRGVGF